MQIEDAEKVLIRFIRESPRTEYSSYGYDVYISNVLRWHLKASGIQDRHETDKEVVNLSSIFYAAAWELCRRGIIRPGVREMGRQSTDHGSAGEGYSVTPFGRTWASESDQDDFVPTEPQRFGQMLNEYTSCFGPGFKERSQEAVRCYGAHAYFACCSMCGAAAESILLAAAIEKRGEEKTYKKYSTSGGRSRVQKDLLAHTSEALRQEFSNLSVLLKYWRDEASHGRAANIGDNEAYTSLALLLRLSQFVKSNWSELTSNAA